MKKYFIVIILTIAHITTNCSNEKEWVQWTEKGFDWKSPSSIFSESFYTRTAVTQCAESLKDAIKGKKILLFLFADTQRALELLPLH